MRSTNQSQELPESGEVMLLAFHQNGRMWRPVIYVGPPEEPNKASELFLGEWRKSLRQAQVSGLRRYFDLYRERYGFSHPEDPLRCKHETLRYNVLSYTDSDSFQLTETNDR